MSCGDCNVCCKVFNVEEVDSPKGIDCQHCTEKGCGIHEERPQVCRDFKCGYFISAEAGKPWPEIQRPDKCGVIINASDSGEYQALRIRDEVNGSIFNRIQMIEETHKVKIIGIDAR